MGFSFLFMFSHMLFQLWIRGEQPFTFITLVKVRLMITGLEMLDKALVALKLFTACITADFDGFLVVFLWGRGSF